jgi:hypothetical protein
MGDVALGHIIDGQYSWAEFRESTASPAQCGELVTAMHNAHKPAGVVVEVGEENKGRGYFRPTTVKPQRLGSLMNGVRSHAVVAIAHYFLDMAGQEQSSVRPLLDNKGTTVADTFMAEQLEAGEPKPELAALKLLFAAARRSLEPSNHEAASFKRSLHSDIRLAARSNSWNPITLFRANQAAYRLAFGRFMFMDIITRGVGAALPEIEATLGRPLPPDALKHFIGHLISPIAASK